MVDALLHDVRYAIRSLRKSPGFTTVALLTLAFGIGANTAMFSIVNGVLLRPMPYHQSERLLKLYTRMAQFEQASVSYPNFLDWQRRSRSFEQMAAYRNENFNLTGEANPERLRGLMVSATMFPGLDLKPIAGRVFTPEEDVRGAAPVVVITSNFWRTRFGADRHIIGRALTLNERVHTVIGVVTSDDVILDRTSVLLPIGQWTEPLFWDRSVGMGMRVVGRLKPAITSRQAESELDIIAQTLAREYPKDNKDRGITVISLREDVVGDASRPLLVLLGAVAFVLLIACANVANLLLARATARRREFAIRGALGAKRSRVIRQLLTESLVLSVTGGALGLGIAGLLHRVFSWWITNQLARADQIRLDATVLAFTAVISVAASVLFGIAPAIQSARSDLNEALKEAERGTIARHGVQRALVVTEVALALVLTASAGLMIRTMSQLWGINPGFDTNHVLTFGIAGSPAVHGTPTAVRNGYEQTTEQLRAVPGVAAVSIMAGSIPMESDSELPYWVEGRPKPPEQSQMDMALFYGVQPDFVNIMRIPLLRGRFLTAQDNENSPCAVVIDEELQHKAFPNRDPLGEHINFDIVPMQCRIVGVAGHIKQWGLDADATAKVHSQIYISFRQFPDSVMDLVSGGTAYVVRTSGDPYAVVPALKRAASGISGKMVLFGEQSMTDVIKDSLLARRFTRLLLGMFAALALALACIGIYGVMSYSVIQTTHDIGVRMALGAGARDVLGMVLHGAIAMMLIGIAIGAALGLAATRVMRGLLFGVSAADPLTFAAVALVLAGVTLLASYLPARRAAKIDPMIALRYE